MGPCARVTLTLNASKAATASTVARKRLVLILCSSSSTLNGSVSRARAERMRARVPGNKNRQLERPPFPYRLYLDDAFILSWQRNPLVTASVTKDAASGGRFPHFPVMSQNA